MTVKNKTIEFLHKIITRTELGQEKADWICEHEALAAVSLASGKLYYEAARTNEQDTVLFETRFAPWMEELNKVDWRIRYKGTVYRIKQMANVKERCFEVQFRGVSALND